MRKPLRECTWDIKIYGGDNDYWWLVSYLEYGGLSFESLCSKDNYTTPEEAEQGFKDFAKLNKIKEYFIHPFIYEKGEKPYK